MFVTIWPTQGSNHLQAVTYLLPCCSFCGNKILWRTEDKISCYDGQRLLCADACNARRHTADWVCRLALQRDTTNDSLCNRRVDNGACLCGWTRACLCLRHLTQYAPVTCLCGKRISCSSLSAGGGERQISPKEFKTERKNGQCNTHIQMHKHNMQT